MRIFDSEHQTGSTEDAGADLGCGIAKHIKNKAEVLWTKSPDLMT